MDYKNDKKSDIIFTKQINAGKRRIYFFDIKKTKNEDYFITLTESTKRLNGSGIDRHKIFLYKEDFNKFLQMLTETVDHIKTNLMPDYDYDYVKEDKDNNHVQADGVKNNLEESDLDW